MIDPETLIPVVTQILSTWNPPRKGSGGEVTNIQTVAVQILAMCMEDDFPWHLLSENQRIAVEQGLVVFNGVIRTDG